MGKVIVELSMSLDGFIARKDNSTDEVHAWYSKGDTQVKMPNNELTFTTDPASAELIRESFQLGANVTRRRTFDDAEAWGGQDQWAFRVLLSPTLFPRSGPEQTRPLSLSRMALRTRLHKPKRRLTVKT